MGLTRCYKTIVFYIYLGKGRRQAVWGRKFPAGFMVGAPVWVWRRSPLEVVAYFVPTDVRKIAKFAYIAKNFNGSQKYMVDVCEGGIAECSPR